MKKLINIISLSILFCGTLLSQTIVSVDLQKKSWLTIKGTTNIVSFKLVQNGDKLADRPISLNITHDKNKIYAGKNQLSIAVKNFTSDNRMALRDFLKLIKSNIYPSFQIKLIYIEMLSSNLKEPINKGVASANITITGVTKQYSFAVKSSQQGEYILVEGGKSINIQDFGLEPPVEMLGLLRVSEWVNIDFHFLCKLTLEKETGKELQLALY